MKNFIFVLFALASGLAHAADKSLVVSLENGDNKVSIKGADCPKGQIPVIAGGKSTTWMTETTKNKVIGTSTYSTYFTDVTVQCAPKICVVHKWPQIFGNPYATISAQPAYKDLTNVENQAELEQQLAKYIADGTCAKTLRGTFPKRY